MFTSSLDDWHAPTEELSTQCYSSLTDSPGPSFVPPWPCSTACATPPTCGLTPGCADLAHLTHLLEILTHDLQVIVKHKDSLLNGSSPARRGGADYEGTTGVLLSLMAFMLHGTGFIALYHAYGRVIPTHWLRTIVFAVIGANVGVILALWAARRTWDGTMLYGLTGLDVGCLLGVLLHLKQASLEAPS